MWGINILSNFLFFAIGANADWPLAAFGFLLASPPAILVVQSQVFIYLYIFMIS